MSTLTENTKQKRAEYHHRPEWSYSQMKVILDNDCELIIPFDCHFKIGSFASGNNLTYEFFILSGNAPYKLVMDYNVWDC